MNGGECRLLERLQESGIGLGFLFEAICDSWVSSLAELEASMGWRSGQAYSQDLREHVLAAVDAGTAVREVATPGQYIVHIQSHDQTPLYRRDGGPLAARSCWPEAGHYHDAIRHRVSAQPDATLDELRAWMLASHGVSVSQGGMWNVLDRLGLMLKERRNTPPSRGGPMSPRPAQPGVRSSRA